MRRDRRWALLAPLCAVLLLPSCRDVASESVEPENEPAAVEPIEGTDLARVILTTDAAQRIGLDTSSITVEGERMTVPASAIWVDVNGDEWVYTNPEPLVFVRAPVVVDRYVGESAVLSKGPAPETEVVSIGVAELIGSEFGI